MGRPPGSKNRKPPAPATPAAATNGRGGDFAAAQYRRQTDGMPSTVGHSFDMLWGYFGNLPDAARAAAGREHLMMLTDYVDYLRRRMEAARRERYEPHEPAKL